MQFTLGLTAEIYAQRDNTYISIYFFSMGIKPFPMEKNTELFTNLNKAQCIMKGTLGLCIHPFSTLLSSSY